MKLNALWALAALPLSLNAFGATWECSNDQNVESAGISLERGKLVGSVSWDCFPGGGICNAEASVTEQQDTAGDLVYRGKAFWLIVHTSKLSRTGDYAAHLIATDLVDDARMGRGFKFDEFLRCSQR